LAGLENYSLKQSPELAIFRVGRRRTVQRVHQNRSQCGRDEEESDQGGKGWRLVLAQVFPEQGAVFDGGLPVERAAGVGEFQEQ
jgi:hypothetical protein